MRLQPVYITLLSFFSASAWAGPALASQPIAVNAGPLSAQAAPLQAQLAQGLQRGPANEAVFNGVVVGFFEIELGIGQIALDGKIELHLIPQRLPRLHQ